MRIAKVKLSELKMDPKLTAMRKVNGIFVSRYRQAMRNGSRFPLMIIDKATMRIVCGNHRYTAMMEEYGPDYEVEVILQNFTDRREVLETFAKDNLAHGNAMDTWTRKLILHELLKEGMTPEQAAVLFQVSVRRIEKYGEQYVAVTGAGKSKTMLPVKCGFEPCDNTVTREEYAVHKQADRGVPVVAMASQLTRWLTGKHVTVNDANIKALNALRIALEDFLDSTDLREAQG